jgi:hypothetical protein
MAKKISATNAIRTFFTDDRLTPAKPTIGEMKDLLEAGKAEFFALGKECAEALGMEIDEPKEKEKLPK